MNPLYPSNKASTYSNMKGQHPCTIESHGDKAELRTKWPLYSPSGLKRQNTPSWKLH